MLFCKKILIQPYKIKNFQGLFSQNFENFTENLSPPLFFSNVIQIFRKCS